jgi:hypothetical protein
VDDPRPGIDASPVEGRRRGIIQQDRSDLAFFRLADRRIQRIGAAGTGAGGHRRGRTRDSQDFRGNLPLVIFFVRKSIVQGLTMGTMKD